MTPKLNRRRFLAISAAASFAAATPAWSTQTLRWSGRALGAQTSMQLTGVTQAQARPIFRAVEHELARLERIFSLYRPDSQLVQLNRTGTLRAPAPEMLELLSLCDRLHRATDGAFDPTLQPIWVLHAQAAAYATPPTDHQMQSAQGLIGWDRVRITSDRVRLERAGMALTLNGVAQGYITDRIAALLKRRGLRDVLIDMGEIVAMGQRPQGGGWSAGIALPDGTIVNRVLLQDRALSTSAPAGTVLNAEQGLGHILNPRSPQAACVNQLVAVSAQQAAIADGLSTAGCLLSPVKLAQAIGSFPQTKLETVI